MITAPPVIETERLRLRPHLFSDKDVHIAMWADERVTRFIGGEPRAPDVSWGKFLGSAGLWPVMGFGYWVFADRATDRLIGQGGLSYFCRGIAELEGVPEAGWAFDADHWGAGYATEAMTAIFGWADAHLDAPEIRCIIDPGNAASEKVAAKLGFGRIGESDALGHVVAIYARPRGG
ncbi:RimJ/RimL family protein N-acetyltransferase [Sphingopyxis panaciterrae]|uniref:GNAT family N-acetyltransferase n=1 Tax=Sphingopyxis panaciterrae TaxID=363841 RepID=UPI001420CCCA|nr:GNAT family N-acetyltransferase [Sphingopyxis panaciterrae]NIJ39214.1 RimJ/RimL family protein N-acetyltransferase [Sphingopyxis panaciterrae]